ncbi:cyclic nucleotide-binding protein [Flavobacterium noncentrifugens]|uniref:cAMP-binding domain of CRP or a regulatory subunit of cAMP-dependent protein kinases n=1 Tax=Flavobacterium noncentrifugens TaxID=1128970 RepID=A0A1G8YBL7_9FLAO|nr:Crp/Fnr family transcriptional regulator [Flavobacterium noncentrifugens]GEP51164.1 cyclic nucleotide-binding protein [Flavobacterium noncentrifugens]SDK00252.1 cAMP-binding domain of CRP or a regulatory subunit of cAMP-dependent protein kinases [Flavobacterium noncentrifugens]
MEADKTALIHFLKQIQVMSDAVAVIAAADFEQVSYQKNELLLAQGQISNDFLFLESGFIRAFTLDTEGNEVTTNFYKPNTIVFEVASFLKRIPTAESFQALTDCTGWKVNYDTFQVLFHSIPEFREFGRANLVNGFIALKERTLSMINLTAEQRYENLINSRPDIFRNASLKHIASYLGITDTSLSRIRKESARK